MPDIELKDGQIQIPDKNRPNPYAESLKREEKKERDIRHEKQQIKAAKSLGAAQKLAAAKILLPSKHYQGPDITNKIGDQIADILNRRDATAAMHADQTGPPSEFRKQIAEISEAGRARDGLTARFQKQEKARLIKERKEEELLEQQRTYKEKYPFMSSLYNLTRWTDVNGGRNTKTKRKPKKSRKKTIRKKTNRKKSTRKRRK
jgi:hypothetical protein